VREALRRLEQDGLVTTNRNRHATVVKPTRTDVIEAHEVRKFLEAGAASIAAQRITDVQLKSLHALAAEATPESRPDWCDAERRFDLALHQTVSEAAGNARLQREIERYLNLFRLVRHQVAQIPERLIAGHREHLAILCALEAHDSNAAASAMSEHITAALHAVLEYLQ
jgi:DNA-binding GntR family transcriptional regulator